MKIMLRAAIAAVVGFVGLLIAQTVDLPVKMTVSFPLPTNAVSRQTITMTNNVIAPVGQGIDLKRVITGTTQFQLGTFPTDSTVTLFLLNVSTNKIIWPSGIVAMGAPMPTNAARIAILFEENFGEVWAYPVYR